MQNQRVNEQILDATKLQRDMEIKLENKEIQAYICGEDVNVQDGLNQLKKSLDDNEIQNIKLV